MSQRRRVVSVVIHPPRNTLINHDIEDGLYVVGLRAVIVYVAVGRTGMNKSAVRPGLTRRRSMPVITDCETFGQLREYVDLLRAVRLHDLRRNHRTCLFSVVQ